MDVNSPKYGNFMGFDPSPNLLQPAPWLRSSLHDLAGYLFPSILVHPFCKSCFCWEYPGWTSHDHFFESCLNPFENHWLLKSSSITTDSNRIPTCKSYKSPKKNTHVWKRHDLSHHHKKKHHLSYCRSCFWFYHHWSYRHDHLQCGAS